MKKTISSFLMLAMLAISISYCRADQQVTESVGSKGLVFAISQPTNLFTKGQAVSLSLVVRNAGQSPIRIPSLFAHDEGSSVALRSGMFLICQKANGAFLAFKGLYFKASEAGRSLGAGEVYKAMTIDLSRCFDLEAGTYDVQLLFATRDSGFVDAASNRIAFTVREE